MTPPTSLRLRNNALDKLPATSRYNMWHIQIFELFRGSRVRHGLVIRYRHCHSKKLRDENSMFSYKFPTCHLII